MIPQDARGYAALLHAVSGVDTLREACLDLVRAAHHPGSLAASDAKLDDHSRFVEIFAGQALNASLDHLLAWQVLVRAGQVPIWAPMTLIRASLEGSLRCRWLVDPAATPSERIARGIAAARDDYVERGRLEKTLGAQAREPKGNGKWAPARIAELEAARYAAGIPRVAFAPVIELAQTYGSPESIEWLVRLSGAFVHGKQWALATLDLAGSREVRPGVVAAFVSQSDQVMLSGTKVAMHHAAVALRESEHYMLATNPR